MRKPFDASLDVANISIDVDSVGSMSAEDIDLLVATFNTYGIAAINSRNSSQPDSDLLSLSSLLGRVAPHKLANRFGIYDIRPQDKENPSYPGTSWKEHPLHTDGAFQTEPERIGCLQCVETAKTGGLSTLASGSLIYQKALEALSPKEVASLFDREAIYIERDGERTTSSILFHFPDGIGIRFRKDDYADIHISNDARPGYEFICDIIDQNHNVLKFLMTPGLILIFDNYGVLHGRTEFSPDDFRHYKRMNCFGDGRLSGEINFGVH